MDSQYIAGVIVMMLSVFLYAVLSLLCVYAEDGGFNQFEILFFRGLISFFFLFISDVVMNNYIMKNEYKLTEASIELESPNEYNIDNNEEMLMALNKSQGGIGDNGSDSGPVSSDELLIENVERTSSTASLDGEQRNTTPPSNIQSAWQKTYLYYTVYLLSTKKWLYLDSLLKPLYLVFLYLSFSYISIGTSTVLIDTSVIFALLTDKFIFKTELYLRHYIVTIFVCIGLLFVWQPSAIFGSLSKSKTNSSASDTDDTLGLVLGYTFGICSAIGEASVLAVTKQFMWVERKHNDNVYLEERGIIVSIEQSMNFAVLYGQSIGSIILGIIGSLIAYQTFLNNVFEGDIILIGYIAIVLTGVTTVAAIYTTNFGLDRLNVSEVGLLFLTEIVWSYVIQIVCLNEIPDLLDIVGSLIIACSISFLLIYNICWAT